MYERLIGKHWWAIALRGAVAIVFGLIALTWSELTIYGLVVFFGLFVLVEGLLLCLGSITSAKQHGNWWALLVAGLIGIAAAFVTFIWPTITALALLYVIAVWAVVSGVFELISSFTLPWELFYKLLLAIGGVLSIIFGILMVSFPGAGALAIIWLIGIYAILYGVTRVILGFELRHVKHEEAKEEESAAAEAEPEPAHEA